MNTSLIEFPDQELAALVAEQEKDDLWGHRVRPRSLSLDFAFEEGGTFADLVGYQTAPTGETGVRRIPRPQRWTRRTILKHIRAWTHEHGTPPSYDDWRSPNGRGFPSTHSVVNRFGSFNAAIEAAGLEPCPRGGRKHEIQGTALRPRMRKQKATARLTSDDLATAYVLYERGGLSTYQLAERLWQKFGYPTPRACRHALYIGFHAEGFKVRDRGEARAQLSPEKRRAMAAAKRLSKTQKAEIRARCGEPQAALAAEYGVSISAISYHQRER